MRDFLELFFSLRYYFAFLLSEAVNNAGGLGFNGFDSKGQPKWDLLTNITPFRLETATSLKVVLDCWNIRKEEFFSKIFFCHRMIDSRNNCLASSYLL